MRKYKRKHPKCARNCYNCNKCTYLGDGGYMCEDSNDDVIKALECCDENDCYLCCYRIGGVDCRDRMQKDALALINRQKAEIERLNKEVDRLSQCVLYHDGIVSDLEKDVFNAKAEAIKEFAERLKENMSNIARMEYGGHIYFCVGYDLIDNLVKEMTEGKTNGCEEV